MKIIIFKVCRLLNIGI